MGSDTVNYEKFESPLYYKKLISRTEKVEDVVKKARNDIKKIINREDSRRFFIVGPCSIHNYNEALEYAEKLKILSDKVKDKIVILMRVYLEKPRTNIGWKGFINDPELNHSYNISEGIELSRKLLIEILKKGVPVSEELLDILVYPYIIDLISFGSIGARTTESQTHRQVVSGLSLPIGFKNSTSGSIEASINAIETAANKHHFLGISEDGHVSKINTNGNKNCCQILRGGDSGPNYEEEFVKEVEERLAEENLSKNIVIDCSHGNSLRDYERQGEVFRDVVNQMKINKNIIGLMLESNLEEGSQEIPEDLTCLKKGVSVTDGCIGWNETERLILEAYEKL